MVATSQDGIEKQHAEAELLIQQNMPCCKSNDDNTSNMIKMIPLSDKVNPTFDNDTQQPNTNQKQDYFLSCPDCFTTLADKVDVSALQKLVQEGYNESAALLMKQQQQQQQQQQNGNNNNNKVMFSKTNYWNPQNASIHNVSIVRPSHDAWGIHKIVLIFCDDFISKIYHLPFYNTIFQSALQPIFNVLPPDFIIVRALLASLPPKITIPVHHDTGEWVKYTHRIHVPIIVTEPNKILFRVGPTPSTMKRIDCTPGHVFEINNQAKHAVSNCSNDYRVHLILDYTLPNEHDAHKHVFNPITMIPKPIQLTPGEKLIQSRRSIDRMIQTTTTNNNKKRPIPNFIILGAQKAGTTSLYDYITQHSWVVKAKRRETHCFDWRWNDKYDDNDKNNKKKDFKKLQYNWICNFYHASQLQYYSSCQTGDSTPSYLLDSYRVIPRIQSACHEFINDLKFFIILRNPVSRAISHYEMVTSNIGTPAQLKTRGTEWRQLSLLQVIQKELELLNEYGLIPYWDIKQCKMKTNNNNFFNEFFYSSQHQDAWQCYMKHCIPLHTGSYGLIARGLYALQLQSWFTKFNVSNQFMILQMEHHFQSIPSTMEKVWKFLQLPNYTIPDDSPKNTRNYEKHDPDKQQAIAILSAFYEPHNQILQELLESTKFDIKMDYNFDLWKQ